MFCVGFAVLVWTAFQGALCIGLALISMASLADCSASTVLLILCEPIALSCGRTPATTSSVRCCRWRREQAQSRRKVSHMDVEWSRVVVEGPHERNSICSIIDRDNRCASDVYRWDVVFRTV